MTNCSSNWVLLFEKFELDILGEWMLLVVVGESEWRRENRVKIV
jgi:hypothetical protein